MGREIMLDHLKRMVRMLLEEDRGSEGQSSWQSGVGEGEYRAGMSRA